MKSFTPSQSEQKNPSFPGKMGKNLNSSKNAGTEQVASDFPGQSGGFSAAAHSSANSANTNRNNPAS